MTRRVKRKMNTFNFLINQHRVKSCALKFNKILNYISVCTEGYDVKELKIKHRSGAFIDLA